MSVADFDAWAKYATGVEQHGNLFGDPWHVYEAKEKHALLACGLSAFVMRPFQRASSPLPSVSEITTRRDAHVGEQDIPPVEGFSPHFEQCHYVPRGY
jgi:hypothetical protein